MIQRGGYQSRRKALALGCIVALAFLVLLGRLFQMQVLVSEGYSAKADENRIRPQRVAALRGRIFDRNGRLLADSRPSFSVSVVPYQVRRDSLVLGRLADLVGVPIDLLKEKSRKGFSRPYEPWAVLRDVDISIVSLVEEQGHHLAGVLIESEPVRLYPYGTLAAHLLGYLGEVSSHELKEGRIGVSGAGVRVGRTGIENFYDSKLRGRDGVHYVQVDARGLPLGTVRLTEPIPGEDIILSIDADLQAHAESLLQAHTAGVVVALDPRSGDVLAFASFPTFDPNLFSVSVSQDDWKGLSADPAHPLLNRGVQSTYPPASTFKPVTAIEGLREGIVTPERKLLPCFGSYKFGRRTFRCWDEEGHGALTLRHAIERSCDVYFYQIGAKMDLDHFSRLAGELGFGKKTGIDLPTEKSGLLPTKKYMNERYGRSGWARGSLLNHSIGQGEILATPLQVACFYAALGTGRFVKPRLMIESVDPGGVKTVYEPATGGRIDIPDEILDTIREAILLAVEGEKPTGRGARVPGTLVAGKTGTAENPHGEHHSWFAAWAPFEDPRIVIAVLVENAGHGGDVAAPMAGELLRSWFGREGV